MWGSSTGLWTDSHTTQSGIVSTWGQPVASPSTRGSHVNGCQTYTRFFLFKSLPTMKIQSCETFSWSPEKMWMVVWYRLQLAFVICKIYTCFFLTILYSKSLKNWFFLYSGSGMCGGALQVFEPIAAQRKVGLCPLGGSQSPLLTLLILSVLLFFCLNLCPLWKSKPLHYNF